MTPPKIITKYDPPPIPDRRCDWCAFYEDDLGEGGCGYGETEEEAIADLKEVYPRDGDWE